MFQKSSPAYADLNGTHLYYEVAGTGQPLVLIHGFSLDTRMWDDQFEVLAARHQVIRYDLRGFGRSALPDGTPYHHTDDLLALLNHLHIESVGLIGLSKGGGVALDFAVLYPERVKALILIDTILGGFYWSGEASTRDGAVWEAARAKGIPAGKANWLAHALFAPAMQQPAVAARLTQIITEYSGWHFVNRNPEQGMKPPAAQRLHELTRPTLVITGEHDVADFLNIANLIAQSVPNCRSVIIPNVGHMANMEAPERVNAILLEWLAEQGLTRTDTA